MINHNINDVKACIERLDKLPVRLMESIHAEALALAEAMRSKAGMRTETSSARSQIEDALNIKARSFRLGGKQAFYARVGNHASADGKDVMAERLGRVVEHTLMQGL